VVSNRNGLLIKDESGDQRVQEEKKIEDREIVYGIVRRWCWKSSVAISVREMVVALVVLWRLWSCQ